MANFYEKFYKGGVEISLKATQITLYAMYIIESRPRIKCELGIWADRCCVVLFYPKCQVLNTFWGWHGAHCATSLAMPLLYQQFSVLAAVQALHYLYKTMSKAMYIALIELTCTKKSTWRPLARTCI